MVFKSVSFQGGRYYEKNTRGFPGGDFHTPGQHTFFRTGLTLGQAGPGTLIFSGWKLIFPWCSLSRPGIALGRDTPPSRPGGTFQSSEFLWLFANVSVGMRSAGPVDSAGKAQGPGPQDAATESYLTGPSAWPSCLCAGAGTQHVGFPVLSGDLCVFFATSPQEVPPCPSQRRPWCHKMAGKTQYAYI
jgi:hypothetical protein